MGLSEPPLGRGDGHSIGHITSLDQAMKHILLPAAMKITFSEMEKEFPPTHGVRGQPGQPEEGASL
jgi:hypothetical protein